MNKVLIGFMGLAMATAANAEIFTVDTGHAEIGFSVKHMMVSNAKGKFNTFEGTLDYDIATKTLKSAEGSIQAASIDTNNEKRDVHLKNEDFFNVGKHPKMTFKSTSIKSTGEGTFEMTGNLNVLGIDREVVLPITINGPVEGKRGATLLGVECITVLNRRDLGIDHGAAAMIGDEVKIDISAEANFK